MMELVININQVFFTLTTLLTLWLFYKAGAGRKMMSLILAWMAITAYLGISGFYQVVGSIPPRFIFLLGPGILAVLLTFATPKGRALARKFSLKWLTVLHIIRVPVEIVLYLLFLQGLVPIYMTFEANNLDILSGITAPIIYYLVFIKNWMGKKWLLIWNFICLGLLINILTIAILSAQTPLQQMAFDQPNIGVTFFPYVWLPTVVVPIVLFSHLASIFKLVSKKDEKPGSN